MPKCSFINRFYFKQIVNLRQFLSIFFFFIELLSFAQPEKVKNLERFDEKLYHFGFTIGINTGDFGMDFDISKVDSLLGVETVKQSGFNLGIVTDLHLGPYWNIRFIPSLSFAQRNLEYRFLQPDNKVKLISRPVESTYLLFPVNFKYRSERLNNFAAYLVAGGNYSLDLASKHDVDNAQNSPEDVVIKLKRHHKIFGLG